MIGIGSSGAPLHIRWASIPAAALALFAVLVSPTRVFAQSGTWTAAAGSTAVWSGTANWSGGTVADGSGNTASFRSTGTTTLDSDRTIGTISSGSGSRGIVGTATLTLATGAGTPTLTGTVSSGTLAIAAPIGGTQGFQKTGTSTTLVLTAANTFSGTALLQSGTTIITNIDALGASGPGNQTVVASGAQLQISTGGSPVTINESFSIAGRGNPTNAAAGNGGAIRILASNVTLAGPITLTGTAELYPNSSSTLTVSGTVSGTGGLIFRQSSNTDVTGNLAHNGWVNRWSGGSGTLTLSGSNSYTGSTAVDNGPMTLNNAYALPTTSRLSVTSGGALDLNGNDITIPTFGWRDDGVNPSGANNSYGGVIFDNSATPGTTTITVTSGSFVLGTAINNGDNGRKLALKVAGNNLSTIRLESQTSTFSGGLTLLTGSGNGTRLSVEAPLTNSGSAGAITSSILGTGTVTVGLAPTDKAQLYTGTGSAGSTILNDFVFNTALGTDAPAGVLLNVTQMTFAGKLAAGQAAVSFVTGDVVPGSVAVLTGRVTSTDSSGGLWLRNSGVNPGIAVRLANQTGTANDYQGPTTVEANTTLALGAANQIPNGTGKGNVSVSGSVKLGGFSETINGLSGSGSVDGGSGTPTLTVGDGDASATFSGAIGNTAGLLSLVKIGSGVQTLASTNTYSGPTSVNAGTLLVNGDQSAANGAVTVAAGATLGGSGTTGGAVTVNGILSPGNSPGVLTVASVILGGSSTSLFEINGTTRGTDYDGVSITTASGLTYDGGLSLSFGNGSAFANNTTFDLFSFTGTPSGNFFSVTSTGYYAGTWTLAAGEWSLTTSEQKLTFTPSTGDLVIAVPEPSTLVLLSGLAVVGFFARRQRGARV